MTIQIPELPKGCGSWVVIQKSTGKAVLEIHKFDRDLAELVRADRFEIRTAWDHLSRMNDRHYTGKCQCCLLEYEEWELINGTCANCQNGQ